jgi:hypothetical protein
LYFNSPVARFGRSYFNITDAPLAIADPIDLCNEQQADYTGKIVIATGVGCPPPTKIRNAQDRGAIVCQFLFKHDFVTRTIHSNTV